MPLNDFRARMVVSLLMVALGIFCVGGCSERVDDSALSPDAVNARLQQYGLPNLPAQTVINRSRTISAQDPTLYVEVQFANEQAADEWFQGLQGTRNESRRSEDPRRIDTYMTMPPGWWPERSDHDSGFSKANRFFSVLKRSGSKVWLYLCET